MSAHRPLYLCAGLLVGVIVGRASADESLRLKCRVIDNAGKPIEGVTARVREVAKQPTTPQEAMLAAASGFLRGKLVSDLPATGQSGYTSTGELKPGKCYAFEFQRKEYLPATSHRSHARDAGETELPNVTLRRIRSVTGRVTDQDGKPLADVDVFQSGNGPQCTETRTASDGSFHLGGLPEDPSLVFVRQDGFWFRGMLAPASDDPLVITMTPRSRPNVERYDMHVQAPPDVTFADKKDAAISTLIDNVRQGAKSGDRFDLVQPFGAMLAVDVDRADELLDEIEISEDLRNLLRHNVVVRMLDTDFEAATATLMAIDDPDWRVTTVYTVLARSQELPLKEQQQLLGMAVTDLRAMDDAYARTHHLARLYPYFVKSGEADTARKLVADAIENLGDGDSPQQRSVYGSLAEAIAPYAPDQALQFLEKADPMWAAWVAWGIAPHMPEEAAALVRKYDFKASGGSRLTRWHCLPRICYQMASANLELAKEMADLSAQATARYERFVPNEFADSAEQQRNPAPILLKAKLYGFMARAVAEDDPEQGRQLLGEAVTMLLPLRDGARNTAGGFIYTPAAVLGSLVRTAGEIDPGWAAEMCWQALALRFSLPFEDTDDAQLLEINHTELVQMAAALDTRLATELLGPLAQRAAARTSDGRTQPAWIVYAYRIVDPVLGMKWLDSLCAKPAVEGQPAPRQLALRLWMLQASQNAEFSRQPIAQQAETWLHSTLWMDGVVND